MRIYFELLLHAIRRKIFMFLPNEQRIRLLRSQGTRIGANCLIHTPYFGVEPYLAPELAVPGLGETVAALLARSPAGEVAPVGLFPLGP